MGFFALRRCASPASCGRQGQSAARMCSLQLKGSRWRARARAEEQQVGFRAIRSALPEHTKPLSRTPMRARHGNRRAPIAIITRIGTVAGAMHSRESFQAVEQQVEPPLSPPRSPSSPSALLPAPPAPPTLRSTEQEGHDHDRPDAQGARRTVGARDLALIVLRRPELFFGSRPRTPTLHAPLHAPRLSSHTHTRHNTNNPF